MGPLDILGLPPDERDERNVRRAYAKLIRKHRPDRDPEGFRRVREAYEEALFMIRIEVIEAAVEPADFNDEPPADDMPRPASSSPSCGWTPSSDEPVDLDEAISAYAELRKRHRSSGPDDLSADDVRTVEAWQKAVLAALEDDPSRLAGRVTNQDLHFEIEIAPPLACSRIVGRWAEIGSPQLVPFAENFLERAQHPSAPIDWGLCLLLARSISLLDSDLAERLASELFQNRPQVAFGALDDIEAHLVLGDAVGHWSLRARRRLTRAIGLEKWPSQPRDEIDLEILTRTADMPKGPARRVLETALPNLIARAGGGMAARQRRQLVRSRPGSDRNFAGALPFVVVVLGILGSGLATLSDGPEPPSISPPPRLSDYGVDLQKLIESSSRDAETYRLPDFTDPESTDDLRQRLRSIQKRDSVHPVARSVLTKAQVYAGCPEDTPERRKTLDLIDRVLESYPNLRQPWNLLVVAVLRTKEAGVRLVLAKGLLASDATGSIDRLLEAYKLGDDGIGAVLEVLLPELGPADQRRVRRAFASR